jgi:hypothetical protein
MALKLSDYRSKVRALLHDARVNYYTDDALNSYINDARIRVAQDTQARREIITVTLTTGLDYYSLDSLTTFGIISGPILSVLNIFITWGNTRYPVERKSWDQLNRFFRVYTTTGYTYLPLAWALVGRTVYLAPPPNQDFSAEFDCVIAPLPMADTASYGFPSADLVIYPPFDYAVALWAAYLAKTYDQSFDEADRFKAEYAGIVILNQMSMGNRVV